MKKIVIVDYGLGNLFSIKQALTKVGADVTISSQPEDILNCDGLILPGVGAFGDAMGRLKEKNLASVIRDVAKNKKPIFGICLGLQLLFTKSFEFGEHEGLDLIPGEVQRFPEGEHTRRVPFIGWNSIQLTARGSEDRVLAGLKKEDKLYFVHSYYVKPKNPDMVLAECNYMNFKYATVISHNNIFGIQGHPEKSASQGLKIYENWLQTIQNKETLV